MRQVGCSTSLHTVSDVCFSFQPCGWEPAWTSKQPTSRSRSGNRTKACSLSSQASCTGTPCHFGARFSGYWCSFAHHLLAQQPHRAWLYVDDLLAALLRSSGDLQLALLVVLLVCLKSPISWKKAALGDSLVWCGWKFNFHSETVSLEPDKLAKLAAQTQALLDGKKADKKALQSCLGLLNWATSISHHLRSYTAPLHSDLNSPPGTRYNTHARVWQRFLFSLDNRAVVIRPVPGLHISASARLIEVGSLRVRRKSDVPLLPNSDKPTWVRIADPTAAEIARTKSSKEARARLLSCVQSTPTKPLSDPYLLRCMSAADAMAEGEIVGIGGWLCSKDGLHWFSEIWTMAQIREVWPQLHKDAQKYIACFETLAQLALLQMAHSRLGHKYLFLAMPAGSAPGRMLTPLPCSSPTSPARRTFGHSRNKLDRFRSRPLACFSFSLRELCQPKGITLHPSRAFTRKRFSEPRPQPFAGTGLL